MCQICGCILTYWYYAVKKKWNNKPLTDYAVSNNEPSTCLRIFF